jgi:DNA-binding NarL/FixJ family response regulator
MNGVEGEQQGSTGPLAPHLVAHDADLAVGSLEILTGRERQVVTCLALGHSTKEVAFALGIADATVRVLLARAAGKLGVRSREALLVHPAVIPLRPTVRRSDPPVQAPADPPAP